MSAFVYHLKYDFFNGLRDRSLLLMNYLFPLVLLFMMGAILGGINPAFVETMIPAMIIITVMTSTLLGMPNPIVTSREAGVYRSFKINGVPAASILTIPLLSSLLHMVAASVIITLCAASLFKAHLPIHWGSFIMIGLLAIFAMGGLGMLIGVITSNPRATILISQLIFVPSMMLSGMTMPLSILPGGIRRMAMILPATHVMNAWRALAFGLTADFNPIVSVFVLLAGGLVAFSLAAFLFRWDSHNQQRGRSPALAILALVPYLLAVIFL
jgi:ABC-2 type transport system permease protein